MHTLKPTARIRQRFHAIIFFLTLSVTVSHSSIADDSALLKTLSDIPATSLLMVDQFGHHHDALNPDTPLIPASTLKILTAWLALEHWGAQHHFMTDFFLDKNQVLWIKGYGDPFLISEEIDLIAQKLRESGLQQVRGIRVDNHYFSRNIKIDGQTATDNPYDAVSGSLAANFNTIYLKKTANRISSAETQTPVTATTIRTGKRLNKGKHRVNIKNAEEGAIYFAEILKQMLIEKGVKVSGSIQQEKIPNGLTPYYQHQNQHSLDDIIAAMLQYSTNFIANQLFLILGAEEYDAPATLEKSQQYVQSQVTSQLGWENFRMLDGAGLSRKNRITSRQLTQLLQRFKPYRHLMPSRMPGVSAKTGTLHNVSSYAGYLNHAGQAAIFALIINAKVPANLRFEVARQLQNQLTPTLER